MALFLLKFISQLHPKEVVYIVAAHQIGEKRLRKRNGASFPAVQRQTEVSELAQRA